MAMEILTYANENYFGKIGGLVGNKYTSNLSGVQEKIAGTYKGIEPYDYVTNGSIMPDLKPYGIYYDNNAFSNFGEKLNEQNVNTQTVGMVR